MQGLGLPHRISRGRLLLDAGEEQLLKIIMIACGDSESDNPWNEAGIVHPLFSLDTPRQRSKITRQVGIHFARLKRRGRAELDDISYESEDGVLNVTVTYKDLVHGGQKEAIVQVREA